MNFFKDWISLTSRSAWPLQSIDNSSQCHTPQSPVDKKTHSKRKVKDANASTAKHQREDVQWLHLQIQHQRRHFQDRIKGKTISSSDITMRMVTILFDWLLDVKVKFKVSDSAFLDSCHLIRRALSTEFFDDLKRQKLQLFGVACFGIAAKFHDVYAPEMRDYHYITDRSCTPKEIVLMEKKVLLALDYRVQPITHYMLAKNLTQVYLPSISLKQQAMQDYICFCTAVDARIGFEFEPFYLALATIAIANQSIGPDSWQEALQPVQYSKKKLRDTVSAISSLAEDLENRNLKSAKRRFSTAKKFHVATITWLADERRNKR